MSKQRKSHVATQRERWELENAQNRDDVSYTQLSEMNFALPAVEYTDFHVQGIIDNDLTFLQTSLLLNVLGNMSANTGILHGCRVSKLAKRLGCSTSCFYNKENNLIDALNAMGMVTLYIKNKKVHGRIHNPPKKRGHKNPLYRLSVSMTHRIALQELFSHTEAKAVIRILLMLSMHCDLNTGEINTEKRALEWAEMIGMSRTSVERAIDYLNEIGITQLKRDYVVTGHLRYTAMARGFLLKYEDLKREQAEQKKADEKAGIPVDKIDYKDIEAKLYRFYGLNATGWMKNQIVEAGKYLLREVRETLEAVKKGKGKLQSELQFG